MLRNEGGLLAGYKIGSRKILAPRKSRLLSYSNNHSTYLHGSHKAYFKKSWFWGALVFGCIGALGSGLLYEKDVVSLDTQPNKQVVTVANVKKHNSLKTGVWVVLNGHVYDLTQFLTVHPGGAKIILKYAGKDASKIFNRFHPDDVFEKFLPSDAYLGPLLGTMEQEPDIASDEDDDERQRWIAAKPPLSQIYNISDFEYVAKKILTPNAWAYYSSGADDEITLRENHYAFQRIFFKPRVLVNTNDIDISTTMLGVKTDAPFYCSAAAQARLGHPDGELSISRGCGSQNIIQMISSSASYSLEAIIAAAKKGQSQWFQLYVTPERSLADKTIKYCEHNGIKAIFVTVDTALLGRREKDLKFRLFGEEDNNDDDIDTEFATENDPILGLKDPGLTWDDIDHFKSITRLPVVIKGIQCVEDVLLAIDHKVDAVVLSNHGGRQLDYSRAPIEVLADLMPVLRERKLDSKIEVYIDGGIRRGTDVVKALCLGAKGVGLGRPFLYANSGYGEKGVAKAIQLLKNEIMLDMKLMGVSKIEDLKPALLDTRSLHSRLAQEDILYDAGYEPLSPPKFASID